MNGEKNTWHEGGYMKINKNTMFTEYAEWWIDIYKSKEVTAVTLQKYYMHIDYIKRNALDVSVSEINRNHFQKIVDSFAEDRVETTVRDFVLSFKAMCLDLVYENIIDKDPLHRIVVWGGKKTVNKQKFLSLHEIKKLIRQINLQKEGQRSSQYYNNWRIYLALKTGVRLSEVLAITEHDIDFENKEISINKTWNYKVTTGGYLTTKSKGSIRRVPLDNTTLFLLKRYLKDNDIKPGYPLFSTSHVAAATVNEILKKHCLNAEIPIITFHSLRHTFTSINIAGGVSINSISKYLGHSDTVITQRVYSHVIDELKEKDTHASNLAMEGF